MSACNAEAVPPVQQAPKPSESLVEQLPTTSDLVRLSRFQPSRQEIAESPATSSFLCRYLHHCDGSKITQPGRTVRPAASKRDWRRPINDSICSAGTAPRIAVSASAAVVLPSNSRQSASSSMESETVSPNAFSRPTAAKRPDVMKSTSQSK